MKIHEISRKCIGFKHFENKLLKICLLFSFAMLLTKKSHPFHSISYRFRDKHFLHKNKFLHLQHNFARQFKGELVHFVHLP